MPRAYFLKEILSNPICTTDGRRIAFEDFGDDMGGITTEDDGLVAELRAAAAGRRGGIVEVDSDAFADAKKKASVNGLRRASQSVSNSPANLAGLPQRKGGAATAPAKGSVPDYDAMKVKVPIVPRAPEKIPVGQKLEVPKDLPPPPERRPRTRRLSEIAVTIPDAEKPTTTSTP